MITEKISSFAIVDENFLVIPSPVFKTNDILKTNVILFNLYRDSEYAVNLRILKEDGSHLVDNTITLAKNPSEKFKDEPYNASITMTTKEMSQDISLNPGNFELEATLGKIDSYEKEENAINVSTKDKSKVYFTIVGSEEEKSYEQ